MNNASTKTVAMRRRFIDNKTRNNPNHKFYSFSDEEKLQSVLKIAESASRLILDIDLDFFSTKNPFLELFPDSDLYSRLKSIYTFEPVPKELSIEEKKKLAIETSAKRNLLIEKLLHLTNYLQDHRFR